MTSDQPDDHEYEFVCAAVTPVPGSFDTRSMVTGAPGLPLAFDCRGQRYRVVECMDAWKETGPCTHGSRERYVRRHWFLIRTEDGSMLKLYFDRQPRSRAARWWLHSRRPPEQRPAPATRTSTSDPLP
jgi:phosphoribosylglycinamide formyltransferase-1